MAVSARRAPRGPSSPNSHPFSLQIRAALKYQDRMPGILFTPCGRRSFLKSTVLSSLALAVARGGAAEREPARDSFHLALLSDTHVPGDRMNGHRGFNPWENLKRIVPEVQQARPEAALVCGDAARLEGLPDDYQEFRSLLQPVADEVPVFVGLGNHDDRANFKKAFPNPPGVPANVADKHVLVIDSAPVRFLLLDSLLYVNKVAGLLGKAQRAWLAQYLGEHADKPTVLFVHHTLGDGDGELLDAAKLFEIVEPHPQVKAIFFGHSHVWSVTQRDRLRLINLPAVGYNFSDDQPVGWVDARFGKDGVDLTLHAFGGNRTEDGKETRIAWV